MRLRELLERRHDHRFQVVAHRDTDDQVVSREGFHTLREAEVAYERAVAVHRNDGVALGLVDLSDGTVLRSTASAFDEFFAPPGYA